MDAQAPVIPDLGMSIALTFVSLGLVCLLAYVVLKWVSRRSLGQGSSPIRVLARCSPEPKRSFFLIQAAGRCFLVGASDGGMSLLAEVDPKGVEQPVASEGPTLFTRAGFGGKGGFKEIFARIVARPKGSEGPQPIPRSIEPEPEHEG